MFETLLSIVDRWGEKFRDTIFPFAFIIRSLILFIMLAFAQFVWRQREYGILLTWVISKSGMEDNSRAFSCVEIQTTIVKTGSYIWLSVGTIPSLH